MPSGKLFYTGSNAGYGSDTVGRDPGIWDLSDNSFKKVPGLRDPRQTETSGSVLLPPAQDQRYMIAGGGGVGESNRSTARTDVIDLNARPSRTSRPGPTWSSRSATRTWSSRPTTGWSSPAARPATAAPERQRHPARATSTTRSERQLDAHGRPDRRAQLPLRGAAAARRPCDHPGQRPALLRRREHEAGHVREAHRDLLAALPVPGRPAGDRERAGADRAAAAPSWFGIPDAGADPIGAAGAPERGHPRDGRGAALDQARLRVATATGST